MNDQLLRDLQAALQSFDQGVHVDPIHECFVKPTTGYLGWARHEHRFPLDDLSVTILDQYLRGNQDGLREATDPPVLYTTFFKQDGMVRILVAEHYDDAEGVVRDIRRGHIRPLILDCRANDLIRVMP